MSILKLENVGYRYNDAPKDSYVFKNINLNLNKERCMQLKGKVEVVKQHFYPL